MAVDPRPAPGTSAAQREYWDAFAAQYELLRESNTLLVARLLHEQLRLADAACVLEVGAGPGGGALAMAQRMGQGARLVVSDLSPVMLELAGRKLQDLRKSAKSACIEFAQADATHLPFGSECFDRYVANLALMLVDAPEQALAEALRVLRPGGQIALSVWGRREHSSLRTLYDEALAQLGIARAPVPAGATPFRLGVREDLVALLERAGFTRVVSWYQPFVEPIESGDAFADDILRTERGARLLDPALLPGVRRRLAQLADERIASGRPIALDILVAIARKPAATTPVHQEQPWQA
jgi:ubiquinone/menaquinone biosynthesis C-methylase UbiE